MAYVGTASAGKVLTATGDAAGSTFLPLGTDSALTNHGVVLSQGNAAFVSASPGIVGQVLTSNGAGSDPSFQNASSGVFPWNNATTSTIMSANNGYTADGVARITLTLPSTCVYGSIIRVCGLSSGGWQIGQNNSQTIHYGNINTTTGTSGFLQSTGQYDVVELLCSVANTDFTVLSVQGNITYN